MTTFSKKVKMRAGLIFSKTLKFYQAQMEVLGDGYKMVEVDDLSAKVRLTICEGCPKDHYNKETEQCGKCKCWMPFKVKLKYEPFKGLLNNDNKEEIQCPLGYW